MGAIHPGYCIKQNHLLYLKRSQNHFYETGITCNGGIYLLQPFVNAQLTIPPNGGNKKSTVAERIGLTDFTIHYDRPGAKGREGEIWGTLVP
jgi:hypothetical protein